jgi:hypothetical protein
MLERVPHTVGNFISAHDEPLSDAMGVLLLLLAVDENGYD